MLDLLPRVVYQIKHRLKRACFFCRGIAQLVEHRSPKPRVVSSNLTAPAKGNKGFARNRRSLCFDSKPILEFTQNQIVSIIGQNKFGQKKPWNILFQGNKWLFIFMSHINYIRYA